MHGFISGLFDLFHWSIFLCLCQYHTVLMTVALQYNLKSGMLISPAPFFFLRTSLYIYIFPLYKIEIDVILCILHLTLSLINTCWIVFGTTVIFTILILPTPEHGISLHLFMSSLISFISVIIIHTQFFCLLRQVCSQILYSFCCKW